MNKLVPLGVGIAAVAVAVLVGGQLIASPASGDVAAVPSVDPRSRAMDITRSASSYSVLVT